jgi:hypothetical protein
MQRPRSGMCHRHTTLPASLPDGAGIPGFPALRHERTHYPYALRMASQIARAGRSDGLRQECGWAVRKWIESPSCSS